MHFYVLRTFNQIGFFKKNIIINIGYYEQNCKLSLNYFIQNPTMLVINIQLFEFNTF